MITRKGRGMEEKSVVGTVNWFDSKRGFGFINGPTCEGTLPKDDNTVETFTGSSFYVHYSYIDSEGYKELKSGQLVRFDPFATPKGNHMAAGNVKVIGVVESNEVEE